MNLPKQKQSLTSLNYKIVNIENHLQNVDRDMNALAEEHAMWKDQKEEWQHSALRTIEYTQSKVRAELNAIYKDIQSRNQRSQEAIARVNSKIVAIRQMQDYCGNLVSQLHSRIEGLEQILGK